MAKKTVMVLIGLVLVLALVLGGWGCAKPAPAQVFEWRLQSTLPHKAAFADVWIDGYINSIKERSNGRLNITFYEPNAIVASLEIYSACKKGAFEVGVVPSTYFLSKVPEAEVEFGLPFNLTSVHQYHDLMFDWRDGAYYKLLDEAYRKTGVHLLGAGFYLETLMSQFPVNKIEDLKGHKIRVMGALARVMKSLGAAPVAMANPEIYAALQRGTVEAVTMAPYCLDAYHYEEVTKYITYPVFKVNAMDTIVNVDAYNGLPKDLQKILDEEVKRSCREDYLKGKQLPEAYVKKYGAGTGYEEREAIDVQDAIDRYGIQKITLPPEEYAKLRAAAMPVWDAIAAKSPGCAALIDLIKAYQKEKGL